MRDHDNSLSRERWAGGIDEMEEDDLEKTRQSSKHKSKDKSKSGQREDKAHKGKDREREKASHAREKESKEVDKDYFSRRDGRKEDKEELERDKNRDRVQERDTDRDYFKDRERDRKDRSKDKDRERDMNGDLEIDPDRVRDKDKRKDKTREKEREKDRDRNRERESEKDHDRSRNVSEKDKIKERTREKEKESDRKDDKLRDKDVRSHKRDESHERSRDLKVNDKSRMVSDIDQDVTKQSRGSKDAEDESETRQAQNSLNDDRSRSNGSAKELEDRIQKMKEERLKKKSENVSEVEAFVSRSRKLEKERVLDLSRKFEEQDNVNEEDDDDGDDNRTQHTTHNLSGVKVLHGIDKVLEGGAVVLTLKDQSILASGGVNEDIDELENIEIGEQKKRDEAYKAAKKKKGVYDDKFLDEPGSEKKMLPQYDDPVADEGITLDASGHFTGEAEKKLEELRRRIQGVPASKNFEDLNAPGRLLSDYYTQDEMLLKFKKPKKKKSLRKKEKLDVDALEAEAVSSGLGAGDLGSRNDSKLEALKEQRERTEAEIRSTAYQTALAKADEASKTLRLGQTSLAEYEEVDAPAIGDDDEEMQKSLARARKIALTKQEETVRSGPQALAMLVSSMTNDSGTENQNSVGAESQEKKIVFTEMEGFFLALQQDEAQAPDGKDVFMEEDDVPNTSEKEAKEEDSVWSEVKESVKDELPEKREEEVAPDETIHEVAVGKGLAGALKLLKDRGALKESVEWGGRNMDKKKSKLAGIYDDEGPKEIHIERTDEYGRILTPKESFRLLSHKFHGKGPGKMKQEKRMRQYQEELKVKQMANSDTPTHSVERMREAQVQQQSPYLVLSGHVKPGQNSDPRSGFATVEKDFPGGLTPMLGDKKVEYFLGKRKPESTRDTGSLKKPKA